MNNTPKKKASTTTKVLLACLWGFAILLFVCFVVILLRKRQEMDNKEKFDYVTIYHPEEGEMEVKESRLDEYLAEDREGGRWYTEEVIYMYFPSRHEKPEDTSVVVKLSEYEEKQLDDYRLYQCSYVMNEAERTYRIVALTEVGIATSNGWIVTDKETVRELGYTMSEGCVPCGSFSHVTQEHPTCNFCEKLQRFSHATQEHICTRCGGEGHQSKNCCTICRSTEHLKKDHICDRCKKTGHAGDDCTAQPCPDCGSFDHKIHEKPVSSVDVEEEPKDVADEAETEDVVEEIVIVASCAFCGGEHKTTEHVCEKCGKTGHRETSHCSICDSLAHTAEGHKCEQCEEIGHGKANCTAKKCAECGSYVPHTHEKKQEPKKEQTKKEEPKKEESKKDETVKEEPKKEEPKREEPKKEEPKPTEKCTTCGNDKHEGDCCSICKKTGHNDAGHKCTKCKGYGHDKSDCKAVKCEFCKTYEHVTSEHPCSMCKIKGHDKENHCDICGTLNHKTDGHLCTMCGKTGHDAATCTVRVEKDKCTICQSTDHTASAHCGKCKEIGHTAAKCTKKECKYCGMNDDHETKDHKCTKCEKTGHDKSDCKAVACEICEEYDHATTAHICIICGGTGHQGNCCKYCKTTAHTTKEHECSLCKQKGHDVNDNKCIYCSLCREYGHEKTGHVCSECGGTGHQGKCCKYCKKNEHTTAKHVCSDCGGTGHQGGCEPEKETLFCMRCQECGHTASSCPRYCEICVQLGIITEQQMNGHSTSEHPCSGGCGKTGVDMRIGGGNTYHCSETHDTKVTGGHDYKPEEETLYCMRCWEKGHTVTDKSSCPQYCEICVQLRLFTEQQPHGHSTSEHPCSGNCGNKGVDKKFGVGNKYHCSSTHKGTVVARSDR